MTFVLKEFFALLRLLNSETGRDSIAAGIVCGMILGFSPLLSLQSLLVFLVIFFFRVQAGAAFSSAFFFKLCAFLFDPLFDVAGKALLEAQGLTPLWTTLYHAPLVPLTRFNNSVVMGSGVIALVFAIPVFFISRILIDRYRATVVARLKGTAAWKALQATSFYKWYAKYEQFQA